MKQEARPPQPKKWNLLNYHLLFCLLHFPFPILWERERVWIQALICCEMSESRCWSHCGCGGIFWYRNIVTNSAASLNTRGHKMQISLSGNKHSLPKYSSGCCWSRAEEDKIIKVWQLLPPLAQLWINQAHARNHQSLTLKQERKEMGIQRLQNVQPFGEFNQTSEREAFFIFSVFNNGSIWQKYEWRGAHVKYLTYK